MPGCGSSTTGAQGGLTQAVQQFRWKLAQFQMCVVPRGGRKVRQGLREAPVGTRPFMVREATGSRGSSSGSGGTRTTARVLPGELSADPATTRGRTALGSTQAADQRLPAGGRDQSPFYVPDPPMWLDFESGKLGFVTDPGGVLRQGGEPSDAETALSYAARGIRLHPSRCSTSSSGASTRKTRWWGLFREAEETPSGDLAGVRPGRDERVVL